jgi:hypothetical protein
MELGEDLPEAQVLHSSRMEWSAGPVRDSLHASALPWAPRYR